VNTWSIVAGEHNSAAVLNANHVMPGGSQPHTGGPAIKSPRVIIDGDEVKGSERSCVPGLKRCRCLLRNEEVSPLIHGLQRHSHGILGSTTGRKLTTLRNTLHTSGLSATARQ